MAKPIRHVLGWASGPRLERSTVADVDKVLLFKYLSKVIEESLLDKQLQGGWTLDRMYYLAVEYVGHDVTPWKVTDPRWDGIGQLIYACNMVWRGNDDGWRIVAETTLALREYN
jgi:hypothetical protein